MMDNKEDVDDLFYDIGMSDFASGLRSVCQKSQSCDSGLNWRERSLGAQKLYGLEHTPDVSFLSEIVHLSMDDGGVPDVILLSLTGDHTEREISHLESSYVSDLHIAKTAMSMLSRDGLVFLLGPFRAGRLPSDPDKSFDAFHDLKKWVEEKKLPSLIILFEEIDETTLPGRTMSRVVEKLLK